MEQTTTQNALAFRTEGGRGGYPAGFGNQSDQFFRDGSESQEDVGLVEYWRILRRHKGAVILAAILGVLLAFLISLPQAPVYQAHASIEIQDVNHDFLNMKQANPVSDGTTYSALSDMQTQIKILQSETLFERVNTKLGGAVSPDAPAVAPSDQSTWQKALHLRGSNPGKGGNPKDLKVKNTPQTRLIEITYDSTDPNYAADFINTLTAEYINSNMEARLQMNQRTSEWMGKQLEDMRVKLEHSEDAVQEYARRTGLVFTGEKEQNSVSEDRLRQVQTSLAAAQADRAMAQAHYEMAKAAPPDSLPEVLSDLSLRGLLEKLTDLRRQEAELLTTYTPKHEKVRRIAAQIAPLESAFDKARASIIERIHNEFEAAQRRERLLAGDLSTQTHVVTGDAEKMVQYSILKREADSSRQLYDNMLQRVKEAGVVSALNASNVRVVDPAKVPERPYKPDYVLNSVLGLFAGLILGVAIVIIRDRADRTLQEPGDAQYWADLTELGAIPSAAAETGDRIYASRRAGAESGPRGSASRGMPSVELMTWNRKPSHVAEAFRSTLTSVLFGDGGSSPQVLVMTSGVPKEGKTTVSTNLAIAIAEIRRRVLLIDADLRKPRMHDLFRLPNQRGLSNLLEEYPLTEEAIDEVIHPTAVPDLFVLPSGPSTHKAANLLYSGNLPELLAMLRPKFDMIIIDTPPMLGMTDARVVGRFADAVVLVVRSGRTTRDAAIAMRQRFAQDQTHVLGTILNDWSPKDSRSGYYGAYGAAGYDSYKSYYTATTDSDTDEEKRSESRQKRSAKTPKGDVKSRLEALRNKSNRFKSKRALQEDPPDFETAEIELEDAGEPEMVTAPPQPVRQAVKPAATAAMKPAAPMATRIAPSAKPNAARDKAKPLVAAVSSPVQTAPLQTAPVQAAPVQAAPVQAAKTKPGPKSSVSMLFRFDEPKRPQVEKPQRTGSRSPVRRAG